MVCAVDNTNVSILATSSHGHIALHPSAPRLIRFMNLKSLSLARCTSIPRRRSFRKDETEPDFSEYLRSSGQQYSQLHGLCRML